MFKHLLLPTDGSALSDTAIRHGLALAREQGARITVLNVVPHFHALTYDTAMLESTREEYAAACRQASRETLAAAERAAGEVGVECHAVTRTDDHPHQAIIDEAQASGCDLIVMASHGRRGLQGVLIGSETQKVLTHTSLPVLVLH